MCGTNLNIPVSVLMSVYTEPIDWIKKAIDSILEQSFANFEFIIVNDKPERKENNNLLQQYARIDDRVKIVTNNKNIGLTRSLNKGLKIAKGKYIARMDADDISVKERLAMQFKFMEENKHVFLLGANMKFIDEHDKVIGNVAYPLEHQKIRIYLLENNSFSHPTLFFRKDLVNKHNMFYNEEFIYSQDYEFVSKICSKFTCQNLSADLLFYRKSQNQIGTAKFVEQNKLANQIRKTNLLSMLASKYNTSINPASNLYNSLVSLYKEKKDDTLFWSTAFYTVIVNLEKVSFVNKLKVLLIFKFSLKKQ